MGGPSFELALNAQAELGEGPVWDPVGKALLWIDIYKGQLHRFDPKTGDDVFVRVPLPIGAVAVRASGGVIAALADGFWTIDLGSGESSPLTKIPKPSETTRLNDGKCDDQGRFWAGTIVLPTGPARSGDASAFKADGSLYRLDRDHGLHKIVDGVAVSNGLGWDPSYKVFYYIDSGKKSVDCFDYDSATGEISNRRTLVELAEDDTPDGMAVDAEGGLWVTVHRNNKSALLRFNSSGQKDEELSLPVDGLTSCAFGGEGLETLFATTRRTGLDRNELSRNPASGGIFRCEPGVKGLQMNAYQG